MEREGLKGCCVCIGPEKGKEEAAPAAKAPTVAELIDELPLGRFHAFHIARQISQRWQNWPTSVASATFSKSC